MARYFSYREIHSKRLPSLEDIRWVAAQISALPPFVGGSAVLCGSVAWGTHTARSDIDVAHFGTAKHPQIEREIASVVESYQQKTKHRFIAPKVDIITIGVDPEEPQYLISGISMPDLGSEGTSMGGVFATNKEKRAVVFSDTFVRFTDHIGSLAHVKEGLWRAFLHNHLSPPLSEHQNIQREAIRSYAALMTKTWEEQPLHRLNLGPGDELTLHQLDLAARAENYSVNLMRRILGARGRYPRPDRAGDIQKAFGMLAEPWAKQIMSATTAFQNVGSEYSKIIAEVQTGSTGMTALDYFERVQALFDPLPFASIQAAVREYLGEAA